MPRKKPEGSESTPTTSRRTTTRRSAAAKPNVRTAAATRSRSTILTAGRPTAEQIRERAYYIYLEHGAPHGHDIDHWLQAERELNSGSDKK